MALNYRIRVSALVGIDRLIRRLGGDPKALLAQAGLTPAMLNSEQKTMEIGALARLLEQCAAGLDCADFGLRLGASQDFRMLGTLGLVVRNCDTPREALRAIRSLMAFHNQSEYWDHQLHGGLLAIRRFDNFHGESDSRQYKEMAISACYHLCRVLIGPDFRAARLDFSHAPCSPLAVYRRLFGAEVLFNQPQDTLWIAAGYLDRKLHRGDAQAKALAERRLAVRLARQDRAQQVGGLIQQTLGTGQANIDHVSALLGVNRRTLQRQLKAQGLEFRSLLLEIRMQSACWHLRYSNMEITTLGEILGYSDLSAFSRAFRARMGLSPAKWRAHRYPPGNGGLPS